MTMQRWDPFRDIESMQDLMERMWEGRWGRSRGEGTEMSTVALPLDIWETANEVKVQASLPGVQPQDVDIRVEGNLLTIRGQSSTEEETKDENYLRRERRFGRFYRQISLPTTVQSDKADATFENGVGTITLPKAEQARPKQIPVRAGQGRQEQRPQGQQEQRTQGRQGGQAA